MAPLPVLVPFLYVQLKLRFRAYNTAAGQLRALQSFYDYSKKFRQLDVDEEVLAGRFDGLLACLDGYAVWLSSGRIAINLIARIGATSDTPAYPVIDSRTRDQYFSALKTYLTWCATRYPSAANQQEREVAGIHTQFTDVIGVIERRFENHILRLSAHRQQYRSLTDDQLIAIRSVIRPGADNNPFPSRLQLRNWLMIELLLETGMRRGELLKLCATDINKGSQHAYLSVIDREHDPNDPRAEEPALKTAARTLGVSMQLYEAYEAYLQVRRRPTNSNRPKKIPYSYLFLSDRVRPLSLRALASVIETLREAVNSLHPKLLPTLSAHDFRHSFADRLLRYLVEHKQLDMEHAMDELRRICGWSPSSTMPRRYAARYIGEAANRHNEERIEASRQRVHKF